MPSLRVLAVAAGLAVMTSTATLTIAAPSFAAGAAAAPAVQGPHPSGPWLRAHRLAAARRLAPAQTPAVIRATGPAIGLPVNPAELSTAGLAKALDLAATAGVTNVSAGATWWFLTENRGPRQYDWSTLDRLVAGAKARGMTVTLQLAGSPDWLHPELASTVADKYTRIWYPPTGAAGLAAWSDFAGDVAAHFTSGVTRIELWNEPNLEDFWRTGPNPEQFAALVRAGYLAVKAANPAIAVSTGGVSRNDVGFTTRVLRALNASPDAAAHNGFLDEIGVHPYSTERSPDVNEARYVHTGPFGLIDDNFLGLTRMATLAGSHKLYVGEYGFSTTDTWMPAVPDVTRASYLSRAVALVKAMPAVSGFTWYHYMPTSSDSPSWSIVTADGRTSQTYAALVRATHAGTTGTTAGAATAPVTATTPVAGPVAPTVTPVQQAVSPTTDPAAPPAPAPAAPADAGVSVAYLASDKSEYTVGEKVTVTSSVTATSATTLPVMIVAVRPHGTETNLDFTQHENIAVPAGQSVTLSQSRTFDAPGTYDMWVAFEVDGHWTDLAPIRQITVV